MRLARAVVDVVVDDVDNDDVDDVDDDDKEEDAANADDVDKVAAVALLDRIAVMPLVAVAFVDAVVVGGVVVAPSPPLAVAARLRLNN